MKEKVKKISVFALPILAVLAVVAIYCEWGWFARLFMFMGFLAAAAAFAVSVYEVVKTDDDDERVKKVKIWSTISWVGKCVMVVGLVLAVIGLLGSVFFGSLASAFTMLLVPEMGVHVGYYIRAKRTPSP